MNRVFQESPDNAFKMIAAVKRHPCAHRMSDGNGLVTVTFVHLRRGSDGACTRCKGIMPLTFWQYTPAAEQIPS